MKIIQLLHKFNTDSYAFFLFGGLLQNNKPNYRYTTKKSLLIVVHAISHLDSAFHPTIIPLPLSNKVIKIIFKIIK